MATAFKRLQKQLEELGAELAAEAGGEGGQRSALQRRADAQRIAGQLAELREPLDKIVLKAKEKDPNKQVYGKAMTDKILALGGQFGELCLQAEGLLGGITPLAEAEEAATAKKTAEAEAEAARVAEAAAREEAEVKAKKEAEAAAKRAQEEAKAQEEAEAVARKDADEAAAKKAADEAGAAQKAAGAAAAAEAPGQSAAREAPTPPTELDEEARAQVKALVDAAAAFLENPRTPAEVAASGAPTHSSAPLSGQARAQAQAQAQGAVPPPAPAPALAPAAPPSRLPGVIKIQGGSPELSAILQEGGSQKLVVVDFSAPWCGPCRAIAPFLEQLAHEYADTCLFVAVDCEASVANRSLATEAAVRAFPTFHFYVNRQRVAETRGANREGLRTEIRKHAPGLAQAAVEDGGMTARLVAALQTVKANASFDEFCAAARTLLTFVSNVIAHPDDPKYKRVRASNSRFHNTLGSKTGGMACMQAVGFSVVMEGGEQVLVMSHVAAELPQVKRMLQDAMVQAEASRPLPARAPAAAPPAPPPAPTSAPGAPAPFGGLGGMGGGGLGNLGAMMNDPMMQQAMQNPAMMQMAQRAMQNPAMMQMAQRMMASGQRPDAGSLSAMMSDPAMQSAAQQMMQSMGGVGGGMPPGGLAGMFGGAAPPPSAPAAAPAPPGGPPVAPTQGNAPAGDAAPAGPGAPDPGTGEQAGMTEEEMIQMAIRRSMEDQG